MKIFLIVT